MYDYRGFKVALEWGEYMNENTLLTLVDKEGGEIVRVTKNTGMSVPKDIIAVKDTYSNEGMVNYLIKNKIIEDDIFHLEPTGFVVVPLYPLTEEMEKKRKQAEEDRNKDK